MALSQLWRVEDIFWFHGHFRTLIELSLIPFLAFINYSVFGGGVGLQRSSFRASCPIPTYFAVWSRPVHLLFISFVLQVVPVLPYIFLSTLFMLLGWKKISYPGQYSSDKRNPSPFEVRLWNRSCQVHEDGLFPPSVGSPSLSHTHSPAF